MTRIPNPLAALASARPEHVVLVWDEQRLTAAEWAREVASTAGLLRSQGVSEGDRIGLVSTGTREFVRAWWAAWWLGAVPVIAGSAQMSSQHGVQRWLDPDRLGPTMEAAPAVDWNLDDPRVGLMTSGSTATPKMVLLTGAQLVFSAFGSAVRLGHSPDDRWLCCLPLHHMGGLSVLWRCCALQTRALIHPRFDPARTSALIDAGEVTLVSLVPDMLRRLLDLRQAPFPKSLRALLVGGERCPEVLLAAARELDAPVALTWGMTETASQVATRSPGDTAARPDSGTPLPFTKVSATQSGRLLIEGPIAPAGGFLSSDRGYLDTRGRVVVEGRADDVIISGGENIAPAAVEAALRQHPAVLEATVVPVDDPRWGHRPAAWVGVSRSIDREALRRFCRERLPHFQIPDRVVITSCDAVPRTASGKADRAEIRRHLQGVHP